MADAADRDLQPDTAGPHRPSAAPTLCGASGGATWNSFPRGYVSLADAVNTVGRDSYGDGWLGDEANGLMRLTGPIRFRGARTPEEQAFVVREREARRQRSKIFSTVRNNLRGSPPAFEDACRVTLISDTDGMLHVLRPEIWINDQEAGSMLASGHAFFHPQSPNWRWSPTGDRISGILLIAAADSPGQGELDPPPLAHPHKTSVAEESDRNQSPAIQGVRLEPKSLLLCEAAHRVADRCGGSIEKAKAALNRAFREHSVIPFDSHFDAIHDWEHAVIGWQKSSIARPGIYTIEGVRVFSQHVDD
jgi:hypothetical protein